MPWCPLGPAIGITSCLGTTLLTPGKFFAPRVSARPFFQHRLDAYPGELSGGQQRRAALARALVNKPALLLADEPTNDLDGPAAAAILDLMLQLAQEAGTTLLLVTHDLAVANRMRRVVTLSAGKITADKQTADLDLAGSGLAGSPSQPGVGPVGAFGYSPPACQGQ